MKTGRDIGTGPLIVILLLPVSVTVARVWFNQFYPRFDFCWGMFSWLLSAFVFSTVVIATLCAFTLKRVGDFSVRLVKWTVSVMALGGALGTTVWGFVAGRHAGEMIVNVTEWLGFSAVLTALLLLPRMQEDEDITKRPT